MGNSTTKVLKPDPLMTDECWEARLKIRESRETFLKNFEAECDNCEDSVDVDDETHHHDDDENNERYKVDSTQYKYPFENLVLEGGGSKGLVYVGVYRVLEEHGLMNQIKRFAGTSAGAIGAALIAVGYNSYDVEKFMSVDMEKLITDSSYLGFLPNLFAKYGWYPGERLKNYLGAALAARTGNPDVTFADVYEKYGNEVCIVVTNVNTMMEEYFHVKTTPDMPIRLAVRMSMSIPGVFQAVQHKLFGKSSYYVDGALVCNYPIHCFDGWWLSMDPKDSLLSKMQILKNLAGSMDPSFRFRRDTGPPKTLGCLVYSGNEAEFYQEQIERKSAVPHGKLPDTKLAREFSKNLRIKEKVDAKYRRMSEAVQHFFTVLDKNNISGRNKITKDEFQKAFEEASFSGEHRELLFGEIDDPNIAFVAIDKDGSGSISLRELLNFIEETGFAMHEKYMGMTRSDFGNILSFLYTMYVGLSTNSNKQYFKDADAERTIGVNTRYISTLNFAMEDEDKKYIIDQGKRCAVRYLQNFLNDHKLEKASDAEIQSRNIPKNLSLSQEEFDKLINI